MNDFNFFTIRFQNNKKARNKTLVIVVIVLIISCFMGGSYLQTNLSIRELKKNIASYEKIQNSEKVIKSTSELGKIKKDLNILDRYFNAVIEASFLLRKEDVIKGVLIKKINSLMPENMMLESLNMSAGSLSIKATSLGRISVAEFSHNLSSSDEFVSVHVKNIINNLDNSDYFDFEISCELKEVIE